MNGVLAVTARGIAVMLGLWVIGCIIAYFDDYSFDDGPVDVIIRGVPIAFFVLLGVLFFLLFSMLVGLLVTTLGGGLL